VLRTQLTGAAIRSAQYDRAADLATAHRQHFGGSIEYLVQRQYRKVPGHEFHYGFQPALCGPNGHGGKTKFRNRRIDHPFFTKFSQHTLGNFVGPIVLGYFFAHDEHFIVPSHLFVHGFPKGFPEGN
jgi:hypothetical protein